MRANPSPVDLRVVAGMTVAAAALYLALLCPEAYWGDSASLSSRLDTTPNPFTRSYWLYKRSALALVAMGLEPALAANATSAAYGALGIGAAAAVILRLGGGPIGAVIGGGSLAVAHTWWSMAEVAEVYTLHGALLLSLLFFTLGRSRSDAVLLGLLAGLSLNHHRMLLPASALLLVFAAARSAQHRRTLASAFAVGALPWLALCLQHPPSSLLPVEGVSPTTLWLQRAFVGGHSSAGEFLPAGERLLPAGLRLGRFTVLNFPGAALLLALPGARWLAQRDRGAAAALTALGVVALVITFALRWAGDVHVYLLGLYPIIAIVAGLGGGALWRRHRAFAAGMGILATVGPAALYAALAFTPASSTVLPHMAEDERVEVLWPGRQGWHRGSSYWSRMDARLPTDSVVIPRWREGTVLEYRQQELGLRKDVRVDLAAKRPYLLAEPQRPTVVTWTPPTQTIPLDVARLDLLLQGEAPGLRRVVVRER
jgi:hypothetical protein